MYSLLLLLSTAGGRLLCACMHNNIEPYSHCKSLVALFKPTAPNNHYSLALLMHYVYLLGDQIQQTEISLIVLVHHVIIQEISDNYGVAESNRREIVFSLAPPDEPLTCLCFLGTCI